MTTYRRPYRPWSASAPDAGAIGDYRTGGTADPEPWQPPQPQPLPRAYDVADVGLLYADPTGRLYLSPEWIAAQAALGGLPPPDPVSADRGKPVGPPHVHRRGGRRRSRALARQLRAEVYRAELRSRDAVATVARYAGDPVESWQADVARPTAELLPIRRAARLGDRDDVHTPRVATVPHGGSAAIDDDGRIRRFGVIASVPVVAVFAARKRSPASTEVGKGPGYVGDRAASLAALAARDPDTMDLVRGVATIAEARMFAHTLWARRPK